MKKRTLQRWFLKNFDEVAGNDEITQYGRDLVRQVRCQGNFNCESAVITGRSRSGKSSQVDFIKKCLSCLNFKFETLTPCDGGCSSCSNNTSLYGNDGWEGYVDVDPAAKTPIRSHIRSIDCSAVTAGDLETLLGELRCISPDEFCLVHLEEVHWLGERNLDQRLLMPLDTYNVGWVATSAYVRKDDAPIRRQLNEMFLNRFPYRLTTRLPAVDDLAIWLLERCDEFQIGVQPRIESTLRLLSESCKQIPGLALQVLARAERRGNLLTQALIKEHRFSFDD